MFDPVPFGCPRRETMYVKRQSGEIRSICTYPDVDETLVGTDIVYSVWYRMYRIEIVIVDQSRRFLPAIFGSGILEIANDLLLLGIDGDDGMPSFMPKFRFVW